MIKYNIFINEDNSEKEFKVGDKVKIPTRKTPVPERITLNLDELKKRSPDIFELPYWVIYSVKTGFHNFVKFKFDGLTPHFHIDDLERYYEVQDDDSQFEDDFVDEEYNYKEKEFEVGDRVRINCPVFECGDWSNKTGVIYKIEKNRYWIKRDDNGEIGNTSNPYLLQLIDEVQDDSQFEEGFEMDEGKINEGKFDLTETSFEIGDSFIVKKVDGIDQYGLRNKMGKVCFVSDKFYGLDFDEPIKGYIGKHIPGSKKGHGLWIFIKGSKYLIEKFIEDDSDFEFDFDPLNESKDIFEEGNRVRCVYNYCQFYNKIGTILRIEKHVHDISIIVKFDNGGVGIFGYYTSLKLINNEVQDNSQFEYGFELDEEYDKKFQVGDRIRIKETLRSGMSFDGCHVVDRIEPMFDLIDKVQDDSQFEEGIEEEVNENKEILTFGFKKGDRIKIPTKKTIDNRYGSIYPYEKILTENSPAFELPFWTILNFNKIGSCDFEELQFFWWPLVDLELYNEIQDDSQFEDDFIDEAVNQQKKVNNPAEEAKKQRERYMQDIERTAEKVAKELQKTKGGNPTKHIHRLVWKYNKHFSLIKNDVYDKVNSKNGVQNR